MTRRIPMEDKFLNDIPNAESLRHAVDLVIEQNKSIKHPPKIFIRELNGLNGGVLVDRCSKFIKSDSAFAAVWEALQNHPKMWTIEDFVIQQGNQWGFPEEIIEKAKQSVEEFNKRRNITRGS